LRATFLCGCPFRKPHVIGHEFPVSVAKRVYFVARKFTDLIVWCVCLTTGELWWIRWRWSYAFAQPTGRCKWELENCQQLDV